MQMFDLTQSHTKSRHFWLLFKSFTHVFLKKRYVICNILWSHVKIWSKNTKAYHRTEMSSSWEVALLHGNTVERTQTACYKDRSHLYCWCSHTCPGRRPGCKVRGLSDWCRSSRALNARSGHRWFAERGKETNNRDKVTLLQMLILQSITISNTKRTHKLLAWLQQSLSWFLFLFIGVLTFIIWTVDFVFVAKLNGADFAICVLL